MATGKGDIRVVITGDASAFNRAMGQVEGTARKAAQSIGNTGRTGFGQVETAATGATAAVGSLGKAAGAMGVALAAASVAGFARSVLDTTIQLDSMTRAMEAIYGSSQAAAAEMEFLRQTADRTGQNVYKLVESYNQLSASTKDTALEGENTRKVFSAMSEAASVLGMSNETAKRAFVALSQMASKGVISMEEMRQQLGEALPGALNLFAKGMDMSTGELTELIGQGKVGAEELVKFADAVHQAYGEAAETAALESAQAAMNKMEEAWTDFKLAISDTSAIVGAIHLITDTIRAAQSAVEAFAAAWNRMLTLYAEGMPAVAGAFTGSALEGEELRLKRIEIAVGKIAEKESELARIRANIAEQGYASPQQTAAVAKLSGEIDTLKGASEGAGRALVSLVPAGRKVEVAVKSAATAKTGMAKASKTAAKAAKDLAKEQERLAKETETAGRAMIEDAAKRRELTAELQEALFGTADAYETLGITSRKSYEEQVKALTDAYQRILSIEELTDSERLRLREALQKGLVELEEDYRGKAEESIGAIAIAWEDLTEDTKQVLHDWVESAIKLEFDSIGEAFEGLAESILNVWIDLLAKMIAEWAISGIASLFSGGNLLGGISSGLGGLLGGVPIIGDLFGGGTVGTLADWGLTAAGTSSVIGGASSLLGGGAGSAAFDWGLNSFGAPALGGGAAAAGAATIFGEQAAAGFTASLDTAMAGGLEWAAIPGKEFFGTGASGAAASPATGGIGAMGAAAGFAAFAGGLFALQQMGQKSNWQSITSPTLGIGVDMPIGNSFGIGDVRDRASNLTRPDYYTGTGGNAGGDSPTEAFGALAEFDLKPIIEDAKGLLDILANQFGDGLASLALNLDGSVAATDRMLDAAAGYDVALSSSAEITDLAAAAVGGSERAMDALRATLMSLGLSEQQTETAMLGLIAATSNQTSALYTAASAASTAASAVSGMTSNINTLSRTPLNIRVGVETYRIDNSNPYAIEHAAGGIYSSPTLIPSIRGTRHLVGEAGAEAIAPLHAGPKTLEIMHNDIKAIAARPVHLAINLDGRQIGNAVLPMVDAHVAAKAARGALATQTRFR